MGSRLTGGSESDRYQAQVGFLRAHGCRCSLRWDGFEPVPVGCCQADMWLGESQRCWWAEVLDNAKAHEAGA